MSISKGFEHRQRLNPLYDYKVALVQELHYVAQL
jgi:hypothetical protein